ncbi:hypothetical protein H6G36_09195 [Anabaena minutissima FACHB-250]|nr:hypothetical protein [Anabaena minutissima FACHB-250]
MNTINVSKVIFTTLVTSVVLTEAIALFGAQPILAQTPMIQMSRNLSSDPLVVNGTSDKTVPSNCGNITATPNQVIRVTEALPYLRVTAKSPVGKTTLLIYGPGGRFCVMADSLSDSYPELSGYWIPGDYSVNVGNLSHKEYSYTIEISQQKKPKK